MTILRTFLLLHLPLLYFTAPADYLSVMQQLIFNVTTTMQCIRIGIVDDLDLEDPIETFDVSLLTDDTSVTLAVPMAVVNIRDNDAVSIGFEREMYSVREGEGPVEVCVVLDRPVQRQLVATVNTADISAGKA